MEFLKSVDTWFLILMVAALGGFSMWAVQYVLVGIKASITELGVTFKESIGELKNMINELYNHRNDHESRLIELETTCRHMHGSTMPVPGGRRPYDPALVPEHEHAH